MLHVTALEDLQLNQPACLTIGAFDGVHRGHQALIGALVQHAHPAGCAAVIITFYPHPSVVLRGRRPSFYLTMPDEKAGYLAALGVDAMVTHPFNHEVANIRAADFVTRLVEHARMRELWCGSDFALGHNREGTVDFLRAEGERRGFTVRVTPPELADGEVISSTRIRQALRDGAVEQAARYLGRPFRLTGQVVEGAKRGRAIGVPTANLSVSEEHAAPATGVYACRAYPAGTPPLHHAQPAVTNIGFRPTFESQSPALTVEAHLLDFSDNLYGRPLTLEFVARLRPEMKFSSVEALLAQIRRDIEDARRILQTVVNSEQ
jgi:riboflavin kinase/FMN adenylyltransferase